MNLEQQFTDLISRYNKTGTHTQPLWEELVGAYSESNRKYHSLAHLEDMYAQLQPLQSQFGNWDAVLFALFYHDAVYNTLRSNNEEKSAELAGERMETIGIPPEVKARVLRHILATKSHVKSADNDTNLFTDADLSILGADEQRYKQYAQQIRQEYWVYPDVVYKPGRKKVLRHFLDMDVIYKTQHFAGLYEKQARINLQTELDTL